MKKFLLYTLIFIFFIVYIYKIHLSTKSIEMTFSENILELDISNYNMYSYYTSDFQEKLEDTAKSLVKSEYNVILININTASIDLLTTLPSIGLSIAQNIIDYREEFGDFKNIQEIKNVKRIGEKIFEKIKDYITVGGENDI